MPANIVEFARIGTCSERAGRKSADFPPLPRARRRRCAGAWGRPLLACLVFLAVLPAAAAEQWETAAADARAGGASSTADRTQANGISHSLRDLRAADLRSSFYTAGSPIPTIGATRCRQSRAHHTVIVMDSRGHGRTHAGCAAVRLRSDGRRRRGTDGRAENPQGRHRRLERRRHYRARSCHAAQGPGR